VHIEMIRSEVNPQFAAIVPPSDVVIVVTFEVELENAIGSLICCLPYATMEPIRGKLHASFQSERLEVDHVWINRFKERLMETPVEIVVRMGHSTISGRQLMNMKKGDIILLDTDEDDLLEAEIEGVRKFHGIPGRVKGNKAFQIVREEAIRF
jgi:flagellar motor switch protein FliM